ncbi:hypothetical protein SRABI106_01016 [Rahnella aquatilis]|nr:hypothetical protein SRABI106_01016 [Rahnella aquatilis]
MRVENFVDTFVKMRFNKSAAGVVDNRPVPPFTNKVEQPADKRGFTDCNSAVYQVVHDLGVLHHMQAADLQV